MDALFVPDSVRGRPAIELAAGHPAAVLEFTMRLAAARWRAALVSL